jgi:hypothetical protein
MTMPLNYRRFVLSILLVFVFTSCSDLSTVPQAQSISNLLPLAVGNQWISQLTYFDSLGNALSSLPPESLLVRADTLIDGVRWFYHSYLGHLLAYRNSEIGSLMRLVSPNTDGRVCLVYKQSARVGESYGFPVVTFSGYNAWLDDSIYKCTNMSLDTIISVPAGTFHCYRFRVVRQGSIDTWWDEFLAPNYGWVQKDTYVRFRQGGSIYRVNSLQATSILIKS